MKFHRVSMIRFYRRNAKEEEIVFCFHLLTFGKIKQDVCSSFRRNVETLYHEIKKEIFNVKDMPQC